MFTPFRFATPKRLVNPLACEEADAELHSHAPYKTAHALTHTHTQHTHTAPDEALGVVFSPC